MKKISRRDFLAHFAGGVGLSSLAGCDYLSQQQPVTKLLGSAEKLNQHVHRLITTDQAMAKEYTPEAISSVFPSNGTTYPKDAEYQAMVATGFLDWKLEVLGLVKKPGHFSLASLRDFPARTQITRHDCVEGWSAIAKWTGVRLSDLFEQVIPLPEARYVLFRCADSMNDAGQKYYESIDLEEAYHPQTILAYALNDQVLPIPHGAPLRLRVERQLGYKHAKYIMQIELIDSFTRIAGGKGGYWEDLGYEWYAGI